MQSKFDHCVYRSFSFLVFAHLKTDSLLQVEISPHQIQIRKEIGAWRHMRTALCHSVKVFNKMGMYPRTDTYRMTKNNGVVNRNLQFLRQKNFTSSGNVSI